MFFKKKRKRNRQKCWSEPYDDEIEVYETRHKSKKKKQKSNSISSKHMDYIISNVLSLRGVYAIEN